MMDNSQMMQAQYTEQVIPDYKGLPLIEALPPILSEEDAEWALHYYPPFQKSEKELDEHLRIHCIDKIFQFNQPWDIHIDLEQRISRMIRGSYANRYPLNPDNPLAPSQAQRVNAIYEGIMNKSYLSVNVPALRSSGLTLIGISGTGKSRGMESILGIYPQVIIHKSYNGKKFEHRQVVWIKINCPYNGSLKGLCQEFLNEYDRITNENSFNRFGNGTAETMSLQIGRIAELSTLGLLIIDEIQNLSTAKSGGQENVLNFFVNLRNKIGVPVILIGTPQAMNVIQRDFRQARRGSGQQGDMMWSNIKQHDKDTWELIMRGIWHYQWTKKDCLYNKELSDAIYDESQGVLDIAIKLFAMAQVRAIRTGKEVVTEEIIRKVGHDQLRLVQPMLDALRSGDPDLILKYPDIQPVNWEEFKAEELSKKKIKQQLHYAPVTQTSIDTIKQRPKQKLNPTKTFENNDIPKAVENGLRDGMNSYESLKEAGVIINLTNDL